jgi:hypothetical protein
MSLIILNKKIVFLRCPTTEETAQKVFHVLTSSSLWFGSSSFVPVSVSKLCEGFD